MASFANNSPVNIRPSPNGPARPDLQQQMLVNTQPVVNTAGQVGNPGVLPGIQLVSSQPNQMVQSAAVPGMQVNPNMIRLPPNRVVGGGGTFVLNTANGGKQLVTILPRSSSTSNSPQNSTAYQNRTIAPRILPHIQPAVPAQNMAQPQVHRSPAMSAQVSSQRLPQQPPQHPQQQRPHLPQQHPQPHQQRMQHNPSQQQQSGGIQATMAPEVAKNKCKNFLSTLIKLAANQTGKVNAQNVTNLIQSLIDGTVQPENFTTQLQKELRSSQQPCLVPFLKKSLNFVRHAMVNNELSIEGIRPPPISSLQVTSTDSIIGSGRLAMPPPLPPGAVQSDMSMMPSSHPQVSHSSNLAIQHIKQAIAAGQAVRIPHHLQNMVAQASGKMIVRPSQASSQQSSPSQLNTAPAPRPAQMGSHFVEPKPVATALQASARKPKWNKDSTPAAEGDDDDLNDVAAMGGVNLSEESARILATNADYIGTEMRSVKDETFCGVHTLQRQIAQIARRNGLQLQAPASELVDITSHAVEVRVRGVVEQIDLLAENRAELHKNDEKAEMTTNVKGQLKFLEDLDKIERQRHDEMEREMLVRLARSRGKTEDPEQLKLKRKAKEMQQAELDELRQKEANLTALAAIGPRKKSKTEVDATSNASSSSQSPRPHLPTRGRMKRVNMKELLHVLENDKQLRKSPFLYKAHLK